MRAIRRLTCVVKHHGLDLDVHVGDAGIEQEVLQSLGLIHARECRGLHIVREEVERLGKIALQDGVIAAVVKRGPAREVILADALDGDLREVVIVHHLPAPDV